MAQYHRRASVPLIVCATRGMTGPMVPIHRRFTHIVVDNLETGSKVVLMARRNCGEVEIIEVLHSSGRTPLILYGFTHIRAILDGEADDTSVYLEDDDG